MPSKSERAELVFALLAKADPAGSHDDAYRLLSDTMNAVEDELSNIPYNPAAWMEDGRLYPPQEDNSRIANDDPRVIRYRSRGHQTLIDENGSIQIRKGTETCLSKPGLDGRTIDELMTPSPMGILPRRP